MWLVAILLDGRDLNSPEIQGYKVAQQFKLSLKTLFYVNTFLRYQTLYTLSNDEVFTP